MSSLSSNATLLARLDERVDGIDCREICTGCGEREEGVSLMLGRTIMIDD